MVMEFIKDDTFVQPTPACSLTYLQSAFITPHFAAPPLGVLESEKKMSIDPKIPTNIYLIVGRQMISLNMSVIKMGRHPDNDIILVEPRISRFHAEIRFENGKFAVYDVESRAGTFANGKRIKHHVLQSGDTISLANLPMLVIDRSNTTFHKVQDPTETLEDREE